MAQQFQVSLALAAASANAIALTQTPASAGNLTIVGGVATLDAARRVLFTPSGSEATNGTTWTVYGTNRTGSLISEVVNGTNSPATATTLNDFATVTRIAVNKAQAGAVVVGTSGVASSPWFIVDRHTTPINLSVTVTTTGVINFSVEYTYDNPNEPFTSAAPAIFTQPAMASQTTSMDAGNIFNFPVFALRLTQNSFTAPATAKMIVAQSGLVSGSTYQPVAILAPPLPPGTYDAATTAWVNAVVAAGGTVGDPYKGRVDALIVGLKADGIWTKLDRLWLFAAENTQSALIDLVVPNSAVAFGAPTFAANTGYTVDGVNGVDLNYNPTVNAVHFAQDNCHMSVWNLFNGTSGGQLITDSPSMSLVMYPKYNITNLCYTRMNDPGLAAAADGLAISDPRGLIVGSRNNSSDRDTYQNGALLGNVSVNSVVLHNAPTWLFVGGPCAAVSFGGSLTSTNHTALYNRLRTYMTAVGIP